MVAAAIGVTAPPPGGAAVSESVRVRDSVLGRSVEGRPIHVTRIGDPGAPVKVLVVGAIHGNEPAGMTVTALLRRRPPALDGVELWVIHDDQPGRRGRGLAPQRARG